MPEFFASRLFLITCLIYAHYTYVPYMQTCRHKQTHSYSHRLNLLSLPLCHSLSIRMSLTMYLLIILSSLQEIMYKYIDPYIVPGERESGLLFGIQEGVSEGDVGSADDLIMGYGFRWEFDYSGKGTVSLSSLPPSLPPSLPSPFLALDCHSLCIHLSLTMYSSVTLCASSFCMLSPHHRIPHISHWRLRPCPLRDV